MAILLDMDEIIIEEKKYVSSKQAAKITGYAKDYVGQLCREGRVPARLVGRSWYVLESAIQDHRFGDTAIEEDTQEKEEPVSRNIDDTWESPRYETSPVETLPKLNRVEYREDAVEPSEDSQNIHDSWKEWFDHVSEAPQAPQDDAFAIEASSQEERQDVQNESSVEEKNGEETEVPLHIVNQPLPREFLPKSAQLDVSPNVRKIVEKSSSKKSNKLMRAISVAGILVATSCLGLAIIGSGYFDTYVVTHTRIGFITGATVYIR